MPVITTEVNTLHLQNVRLSFPDLLVAKSSAENSAPRYAASFIMAPDAPEWAEIHGMANKMYAEKWGEHAAGVAQLIQGDKKLRCWAFGQEKLDKNGIILDGFEGNVVLSALRKEEDGRPKLYGQDGQVCPPTAPLNEMFAGGNYVNAVVSFWLQQNQFGRALRCQLIGIQYANEGEKFGMSEADAGAVFAPVSGAPPAPAPMAPPVVPAAAPAAPAVPAMPALPGGVDPLS